MDFVNIGVGEDITIRELVEMVQEVVGFSGEVAWDTTRPDGTPRKLVDADRIHGPGWQAKIPLGKGIRSTYAWFLENREEFRR